jgi:hypothetical protein
VNAGKNDGNKPKKVYTKPPLTVYGKVSELTATVGLTNAKDGGTRKMPKTAI